MQMFYVAHTWITHKISLLSQSCHKDINKVKRRLLKSPASKMFLQMGKTVILYVSSLKIQKRPQLFSNLPGYKSLQSKFSDLRFSQDQIIRAMLSTFILGFLFLLRNFRWSMNKTRYFNETVGNISKSVKLWKINLWEIKRSKAIIFTLPASCMPGKCGHSSIVDWDAGLRGSPSGLFYCCCCPHNQWKLCLYPHENPARRDQVL